MASIRNIYMNNIYIYILKLDEDIWKTSWKLNTHIYIYIYYIMGVAIYIYTSGQRLHSELENQNFYSRLIIYK